MEGTTKSAEEIADKQNAIAPPPDKPPDIRTLVIDIARLAGFHPRTSQPLPGTMLLWKGYVHLRDATPTYRALKELDMFKH